MTRPSLAGIEQRAEAHQDWQGRFDSRERVDTALASAADVPALRAAVRDVLALHQPCDNDITRTPICQTCRGRAGVWECGCWADEDRQPVCSSCTDSDPLGRVTPSAYPCATVRAIAAHLDLTDPEGEPTRLARSRPLPNWTRYRSGAPSRCTTRTGASDTTAHGCATTGTS